MNGKPSFAHCEATLFLRIKQGQYGNVNLDGMNLVNSGGMCAIDYQKRAAVYFSSSDSPERRAAFIALNASFTSTSPGDPGVRVVPLDALGIGARLLNVSIPGILALNSAFSPPPAQELYVRVVPLNAQVTDEHLFKVSIPGILEIEVDRNWGLSAPPMPMVAAPDHFANLLQYVQNIRYSIHDPEAGLDFDYSRRQANYRVVDLTDEQYRTKSMLIQYSDYSGWYSPGQMALIKAQHLPIPDLAALREQASRLRGARGSH